MELSAAKSPETYDGVGTSGVIGIMNAIEKHDSRRVREDGSRSMGFQKSN